MKFTADRKTFAAALAPVVKVVQRRTTIPILGNVLIEATADTIRLTGDSLDIRITAPLAGTVERPGATTVPGHLLNDIVRRSPEGPITFDQGDELRVAVRAGRGRFAVPLLPAADFPDPRRAEWEAAFVLPAKQLSEVLARTTYAISTEETRYYLNGVFIHPYIVEGHTSLRFVATNGHCLACAELDLPDDATLMKGLILPRESAAEIGRLAETAPGDVTIRTSQGLMSFDFSGGVGLVTKLIDGTFPDYLRVVPAGGDKTVVSDTAAIADAIARIAVVADRKGTAFGFGANSLTLAVDNADKGAFAEEIEVATTGPTEGFTMGFNATYVSETLASLDCDQVEMVFSEAGAPGLFRPKGQIAPFGVVMPIRV